MSKVKLGSKVKDEITGHEGVAMSRTEFLFGCTRVGVETIKDNEISETWFDEPRLKVIKGEKAFRPDPEQVKKNPGGGRVPPARRTR